jgi:hypothetical protein
VTVNFFTASNAPDERKLKTAKILCGLVCLLILVSNIWTISRWSESRGVYDDICYLRQAHLFRQFGLDGLNTDITRDHDHYLASKLQEIGFPTWNDPATVPCHSLMPATQRRVMQYPPGTGFVLALFPAGFQTIPLYVLATVIVFGFVLLAISLARTWPAMLLTVGFGCLALCLMINPTKASYSMAPTMVICVLAGFFTARLFAAGQRRNRFALSALVGFLIGLAVDFRLPNLFLCSGYFLFFFVSFLKSRKAETVVQVILFGAAFLAGMAPTLLANAINAGSAFSTTYGAADTVPPDFNLGIIRRYVTDMQFVLLVLATVSTALILRLNRGNGITQTALVAAGNLLVNLAYFMSHPVFTPYYTVPVAVLSLWSLLFAGLMQSAEAVDADLPGRPARV